MTRIPFIPESAPFTPEQRARLNGYLAGLFADANPGAGSAPNAAPPKPAAPLLVLYGSQTGTAEQLARRFAQDAGKRSNALEDLLIEEAARLGRGVPRVRNGLAPALDRGGHRVAA